MTHLHCRYPRFSHILSLQGWVKDIYFKILTSWISMQNGNLHNSNVAEGYGRIPQCYSSVHFNYRNEA